MSYPGRLYPRFRCEAQAAILRELQLGGLVAKKTIAEDAGAPGVKRKPMSLYLEPCLYDRLRKLAFDKRQPMTELMVRGIEMVLKAERY